MKKFLFLVIATLVTSIGVDAQKIKKNYWCPIKIKMGINRCLNRRFNAVEILFCDLQAPPLIKKSQLWRWIFI
ncbi:MAG: hypothetical protein IKV32_04960, partial [Muribaculaceae bacterium]|nr:hypothetical protein [Muribaculaceae bacterium]